MQINYLDWENPSVQSRRLYEIVWKHNKPFAIIEPTKGDLLAGGDTKVTELILDQPGGWTVHTYLSGSGVGNAGRIEADRLFGTFDPGVNLLIAVRWVDEEPGLFTTSGYELFVNNRLRNLFEADESADEVYVPGYGVINLRDLVNYPAVSTFFEFNFIPNQFAEINDPDGYGPRLGLPLFILIVVGLAMLGVVVWRKHKMAKESYKN